MTNGAAAAHSARTADRSRTRTIASHGSLARVVYVLEGTMRAVVQAGIVTIAALLLPSCGGHDPLGPTPVDQGIIIFVHADFRGTSQQLAADVNDLGKVEGPCGTTESESDRTWNDCISSVRVLPGWRATLYGDKDFRGATIEVTEDVRDLGALHGGCSGSLNDCISSIRVTRR